MEAGDTQSLNSSGETGIQTLDPLVHKPRA